MNRVALIGENSVEYVNALLDIWNSGGCAVLLDWRIPFKTAVKMMVEAGVKRCCIESGKYDDTKDIFPESIEPEVFERRSNSAKLLPQYIYDKYRDNYSDNEAVVIYSSGTTGTAKGIILSHYAIQTNADAIINYMNPVTDDCIYIAKVMSHSSTLTGELLVALKSGMKVVVAPTIVPPRVILGNIEKFNASIACLNPTLLSILCDETNRKSYDFSSLRTIYVSGSILNDKIYEKAHSTFADIPIYNVYGLSEAGPRVSAQRAECCENNSVGKAIKDVNIVIVDDSGQVVPRDHRGIVHVKTPSVFSGYVSGTRRISLYDPEWLNTGDIGFFDTYGELHIVGRSDDLIIIDSHKIYPSEVERAILMCDRVEDCAVTKVDYNGNEFLACLYTGEKASESIIRESLRDKLSTHEIPRRFVYCETLPQTPNGKIASHKIKNKILKEMRNRHDEYKE